MFSRIRVDVTERAILSRGGLPVRAFGPGEHWVFGFGWTVQRLPAHAILFVAAPEVRAVLPPDWYGEVDVAPHERAIVYHDGRPRFFLRPGVHRYWKIDPAVRVEVFSVRAPMPPMSTELAQLVPATEYAECTVREYERGLEYVAGTLVGVLPPGRHLRWSPPEARVEMRAVDMRRTQVALTGQELMTKDKVTLRLSLTLELAVADPVAAAHAVQDVKEALYLIVQLAARDYVAATTLDELLAARDAMAQFLEADARAKSASFGVEVVRVGVKDVVLPGEMKTLLNRVIEAEKEALANIILRREETAAMRALASTARVMAEQPLIMRLKEMETLKEIAEHVKEVKVVVGKDGLSALFPNVGS